MAGAVGRLLLLLALLAAAALCACGGGEDGAAAEQETPLAVPWLDPDGEFPVVGSLAVNPADAKLWMATNTGLFRVPGAGKAPVKVTGRLTTSDGAGGDLRAAGRQLHRARRAPRLRPPGRRTAACRRRWG